MVDTQTPMAPIPQAPPVPAPQVDAGDSAPEASTTPVATTPVYDSRFKRVVEATPDQIKANPSRFEDIGASKDQKVYMVAPNGTKVTLQAHGVDQALGYGYNFATREDVAHQNTIEAYARKHDSGFETGVKSMANQLLFGAPDAIEDSEIEGKHGVFSTGESSDELQGERLARERHETAGYIGGGVGLALNTAVTAGLGEAFGGAKAVDAATQTGLQAGKATAQGIASEAAPGLLQRVASATGRGALEGAAYSVPQAVVQASFGDYDHAGESLLWGMGAGGILGMGTKTFSEAVAGGSNRLKAAARDGLASRGLLDEAGNLDTKKLGFGSAEDIAKMRTEAASALSDHSALLDKEIAKAKPQITLPGLDDAVTKPKALGIVPTDLAHTVQDQVLSTREGLTLPGFKPKASEDLTGIVKSIAQFGDKPISFETLQDLRNTVAKGIGEQSERGRLIRQIDGIIGTEQTKAMSNAYSNLKLSPGFADYLTQLQKIQGKLGLAGDLSHPLLAQTLSNWGVGAASNAISGSIGGAVGGAVGGPVGAWLGFKALKPIVDTALQHTLLPKALDLSGRELQKIADSPESIGWFGAALAKDTSSAALNKLTEVPRSLGTKVLATNMPDPVKQFLGQKAVGLSKDQQYQKVVDTLAQAKADPQRIAQEVQTANHMFSFDPRLAAAYSGKALQFIDYMHEATPKNPNAPIPFQKDTWQPTARQKQDFLSKLEVGQNPWAVMDRINSGTLTPAHVDALKTLYPGLHDKLVGAIARMSQDPDRADLPAGIKHGLSMLTGVNLTNPTQINHQAAYMQVNGGAPGMQSGPQGGPGPQGPSGPKHHGGGHKKTDLSGLPGLATPTQKLQFKL